MGRRLRTFVNLILLFCLVLGTLYLNPDTAFAANEPALSSGAAMVYCENTGTAVYAKNLNVKYAPGGLTRMMTALIAAQTLPMDKEIKISKTAANQSASSLGLKEKELIPVKDLLSATLLFGSDTAAYALAENTFGSVDEFIENMNKTVKNLDCKKTRFRSVTGRYVRGQHTTAKDYMRILKVALSNRIIREIGSKRTYRFAPTNKHKERTLKRETVLTDDNLEICGYTGIAALQDRQGAVRIDDNGMRLFVVLLENSQQQRQSDLIALTGYAKDSIDGYRVVKKGKKLGKVKIGHGEKTEIDAYSLKDGYAYLPKEGSKALIRTRSIMYGNVTAPVKKGQVVGHCNIYVGDEVTHKVPLVAGETVGEGWFPSYIGISNFSAIIIMAVIIIMALLLLTVIILKTKARRRRNRRRKRRIRRIVEQQLREEEENKRRSRRY